MSKELLKAGDKAPAFTCEAAIAPDQQKTISLSDYQGKYLVLYFYPKDDTPGCTKEACAFQDIAQEFGKLNAYVLGVSKDSIEKHHKFQKKYKLDFPLLADTDGTVCDAYKVFREKFNFGKSALGIVRSTFIINPAGDIVKSWNSVKVDGHAAQVQKILDAEKAAA